MTLKVFVTHIENEKFFWALILEDVGVLISLLKEILFC